MNTVKTARITAAALAVGLGVGGLGATPAAAASDTLAPRITVHKPETDLAIPAEGVARYRFNEKVVDHSGVSRVEFGVFDGADVLTYPDGSPIVIRMIRTRGSSHNGTWTGELTLDRSALPGTFIVRSVAWDKKGNLSKPKKVGTFTARYDTAIADFAIARTTPSGALVENVTPLTLSGKVGVASPIGWVGLANTALQVRFDPKGSAGSRQIGTVTTDAAGNIADTSFEYPGAGKWRLVYAGSPVNQGSRSQLVGSIG